MESADLAHERCAKSGTRCAASALADVTATMQAAAPASASTQRVLRRTYTYKILTLMILAAILQCSLAFSSSRLQAQRCRDGRALRRDIQCFPAKSMSPLSTATYTRLLWREDSSIWQESTECASK